MTPSILLAALHASPSSCDTVLDCWRKWAWDKIAKIPRAENRFAALGTAVHNQLEMYTKHGIFPDLATKVGEIAFPALAHIPLPETIGVTAEREVTWRRPGKPTYLFRQDLRIVTAEGVEVVDYKTTGRPDFMKTAEQLTTRDPQGIIYAAHELSSAHPMGGPPVALRWLYLLTSPPYKCLPVRATVQRETCLEKLDELDALSAIMLSHMHARTDPMALPPSPEACSKYSGCPYSAAKGGPCRLTQREELYRMSAPSYLSQIRGRAEAGAAVTPGSTTGNQAQVPAAVVSAPVIVPAVAEPVAPTATKPWLVKKAAPTAAPTAAPAIVNESPVSDPVEVDETEPTLAQAAEAEALIDDLPQIPIDPSPTPKRRGRPKKAPAADPLFDGVSSDPSADEDGPEPVEIVSRNDKDYLEERLADAALHGPMALMPAESIIEKVEKLANWLRRGAL